MIVVPAVSVTLVSVWILPDATTVHPSIDIVASESYPLSHLSVPVDLNTITDSFTLLWLPYPR